MRSDLITPFSLPCEPVDESLFNTVICTNATGTLGLFLEVHRKRVEACSGELYAFLSGWLGKPASPQRARAGWSMAFGQAGLALKDGRVDPAEVAVRVAVTLIETGHDGDWSAPIKPAPLIFDGRVIRDVVRAEAALSGSDGATLKLVDAAGAEHVFERIGGAWMAANVPRMPTVAPFGRAHLVPNYALPTGGGSDFFRECHTVSSIDDAAIATFRGGFEALDAAAPEYRAWIDRALNGIVVGALQPAFKTVSGSWEEVPGYVHSSYPHSPVVIAELLVHECSHQYYYMLERLGPIDDGTDTELYWSPPIRKARPLSRVLMAYHALANTLLFFNRIKQTGYDDRGYVDANEAFLREDIQTLAKPLRGNPALTEFGRGLFQPLDERITEFA